MRYFVETMSMDIAPNLPMMSPTTQRSTTAKWYQGRRERRKEGRSRKTNKNGTILPPIILLYVFLIPKHPFHTRARSTKSTSTPGSRTPSFTGCIRLFLPIFDWCQLRCNVHHTLALLQPHSPPHAQTNTPLNQHHLLCTAHPVSTLVLLIAGYIAVLCGYFLHFGLLAYKTD